MAIETSKPEPETIKTFRGTEFRVVHEALRYAHGRFIFKCACGWKAARNTERAVWGTWMRRGKPTGDVVVNLPEPDGTACWYMLAPSDSCPVRPCPKCAKKVRGTRVIGIRTAHECDPRCMGATGPRCECSCGGANHGGSFGSVPFTC